jgi:hypothetical protein
MSDTAYKGPRDPINAPVNQNSNVVRVPLPPAVRVALRVILNHVENPKRWKNSIAVVKLWLDSLK